MGELGKELARRTTLPGPVCVLAGGELTVTVRGSGTGGRAQEFALAAALAVQGTPGVLVAGVGTDGRDGPIDAAGAVAHGQADARGKGKRMDSEGFFRKDKHHTFFKEVGGQINARP